jgi:hypothetical protein|tara:strand:- start:3613 stop:5331 length:1719 start_codon:yes stop_codon:yes gene_type:complete
MTDEQPKKKKQRSYHFSAKQKAVMAARRAAKRAENTAASAQKEAKKLKAKANAIKSKAKKKAEAAAILARNLEGKNTVKDGTVVTDTVIKQSPQASQAAIESEIIFQAHPGPQTEFLSSSELEVLYGGAAGGGKSYAMLADPLRNAHLQAHKALLLRKSMPELLELIDNSRILYPKAFPGAKFQEQKQRWMFPSGATLQFSFVDNDHDVYRFQGQAFTWIGVDELGHYGTPFVWNYLRSRLRRTDLSITPYMRATANPGGLGGWWIKKMFVDPADWNDAFWATDMETGKVLRYPDVESVPAEWRGQPLFKRRFIPAKLTDNPSLMQSPDYLANLASLPEVERRRLLEGDWNVSEDSAFPEFNTQVHVVKSFPIPHQWARFRACDYGYVAWSGVLWFAVDFEGRLHVYRELYEKGLNAEQLADRILAMEADEPRPLTGPLDNECWANRGQVGPSIAELMIQNGVKWQKADKGPGSRINGKVEIHRVLAHNMEFDGPSMVIHNNCRNLVRTMPILPLDPNKPEDVDTKFAEDHLYDTLRYGVTSRHNRRTMHPTEMSYRAQAEEYRPADGIFGY